MKLSEIVASYMESNPGSLLDDPAVHKHLTNAVSQYAGYATISSQLPGAELQGQDYDITPSELAIIRPLFMLYCEQANAILLEASRGMAVEVFGRSTSEIAADIKEYEANLPSMAFYEEPMTI